MTTKTLIYSIIGIFVMATGAYIIISPIATRTLDAPVVENYQEDIKDNQQATTTQEVKQIEVKTTATIKPTITPIQPSAPTTPVIPSSLPPDPVVSGYTASEVAVHSSESSCWSIVNGVVYDLTTYISRHPGGSKNIIKICGKDGTSAFEGQHEGESKPEKILASYKIGVLK